MYSTKIPREYSFFERQLRSTYRQIRDMVSAMHLLKKRNCSSYMLPPRERADRSNVDGVLKIYPSTSPQQFVKEKRQASQFNRRFDVRAQRHLTNESNNTFT